MRKDARIRRSKRIDMTGSNRKICGVIHAVVYFVDHERYRTILGLGVACIAALQRDKRMVEVNVVVHALEVFPP